MLIKQKNYLGNGWKSIKRKNVKNGLIELYCISNTHSINQAKILLSKIILHFSFKMIKMKDIIFKNGKIEKIFFNI